jgi:hypothetical protein
MEAVVGRFGRSRAVARPARGEGDVDGGGHRARVERVGACSSAATRDRSTALETPPAAGEPGSVVAAISSGTHTASRRKYSNGIPAASATASRSCSMSGH